MESLISSFGISYHQVADNAHLYSHQFFIFIDSREAIIVWRRGDLMAHQEQLSSER